MRKEQAMREIEKLVPILIGMIEGSGMPENRQDLYAPDFSAPDGDVFVQRAAELLLEFSRAASVSDPVAVEAIAALQAAQQNIASSIDNCDEYELPQWRVYESAIVALRTALVGVSPVEIKDA